MGSAPKWAEIGAEVRWSGLVGQAGREASETGVQKIDILRNYFVHHSQVFIVFRCFGRQVSTFIAPVVDLLYTCRRCPIRSGRTVGEVEQFATAGGEDVRGPAPVCPCCREVCASRAVEAAAAGAGGRLGGRVAAGRRYFRLHDGSPAASAGSTGQKKAEISGRSPFI